MESEKHWWEVGGVCTLFHSSSLSRAKQSVRKPVLVKWSDSKDGHFPLLSLKTLHLLSISEDYNILYFSFWELYWLSSLLKTILISYISEDLKIWTTVEEIPSKVSTVGIFVEKI